MRLHSLPCRASLLAALAAAGCATADEPPSAAASPRTLVGDAACDTDAQCATIGVGAKACGGPASYLAWSALRTDGARLRAAVEREAEAQRQAQAASGRVSDCALAVDPSAYCDRSQPRAAGPAGVCRLREVRTPTVR
jgi:hypothetical protein